VRAKRWNGKLLLAAVGSAAVALSQTPSPTAHPAFEVASIKPNSSGGNAAYIQPLPGSRLVLKNFAVLQLILSAYGLQSYQISGDPPWIGTDHYDIEAKSEGNASVQQMEGPMLRALLEDRFKLMLHRETRQLPVYELTVAKSGVKLERSKEGSCIPYSVDAPPPPAPAPGAPRLNYCGYPRSGVEGLNRTLDGAGVSMAVLASRLSLNYSTQLGRTVIDRTALTGTFDVHLKWTAEASAGAAGPGTADDPAGPSLFTALQEQLGLKLESAKGPVEVLVIDHVEKPSAN
jgi:uncharacterized protein (TIGR03435 family)